MKVEMYSLVRQVTGEKELELEASDIEQALIQMAQRYGEEFESQVYSKKEGLSDRINILLRGKNIHVLQGLATPLEHNDTISLFYSIEGG
ncbi:MoaD family protein [Clostridia bacterium]|nr:MoaD family protein [Clostridia bacterium]